METILYSSECSNSLRWGIELMLSNAQAAHNWMQFYYPPEEDREEALFKMIRAHLFKCQIIQSTVSLGSKKNSTYHIQLDHVTVAVDEDLQMDQGPGHFAFLSGPHLSAPSSSECPVSHIP